MRADVLLTVLLLTVCCHAATAWLPDSERAVANRILDCTIRTEYAEAFRLADSMESATEPAFRMLKLTAIGLRDLDYEQVVDAALFERTYSMAIAAIDSCELRDGVNPYTMTLRGFCMSVLASYDLRRRNYARAVGTGVDALKLLERAAADSTVADPDYFLGLYDWSRAGLRRRLWWVLFWLPGNRERGLARLERCVSQSMFSSAAASLALVEVYGYAGRSADAERTLEGLYARYPGSRFVLWAEAKYRETLKQWDRVASTYEALAGSYGSDPLGGYNQAQCQFAQAHAHEQAGSPAAAVAVLRSMERECAGRFSADICSEVQSRIRRVGTRGSR